MKPHFKNGKLTVELHKPDESILRKARELGEAAPDGLWHRK